MAAKSEVGEKEMLSDSIPKKGLVSAGYCPGNEARKKYETFNENSL
jgi:hypothetical protein